MDRTAWLRRAIVPAALVVGLGVGAGAGYGFQQSAVQAAGRSAAATKTALQAQARDRQSQLDARAAALDEAERSLDRTRIALDQRQKDLDARTAALKATSFGDGLFQVGRDVQPGTYREIQPVGNCYYAKLRSDTTSDIIDNANTTGPATVSLAAPVAYFQSRGCGTWTKIG